ncbi:hypothetical protein BD769DRAFT_1485787 [Suillus cothurnatus]|nr:hypothetical protein BD769DRAFT_1485787 [Suillus cothurnatus]
MWIFLLIMCLTAIEVCVIDNGTRHLVHQHLCKIAAVQHAFCHNVLAPCLLHDDMDGAGDVAHTVAHPAVRCYNRVDGSRRYFMMGTAL